MLALIEDIKAAYKYDPAARNLLELIFAYPGLHAIWWHRLAHFLWRIKFPFLPRLISHLNRFLTGIEIHPGAKLGKGVFIDHGMGIVIGETAEVGDYCLIYQGVTLGGTSLKKGKRHPTLEDHVIVGAGAKVLGNITIGSHSRIGANSVVLKPIPPRSTVVGIPGRIISAARDTEKFPLDHHALPDPVARAINTLIDRIIMLEKQLETLQNHHTTRFYNLEEELKELKQIFRNGGKNAFKVEKEAENEGSGYNPEEERIS